MTHKENSDYPGKFWSALEDGKILCELCPRYCKIGEGQRGFCFVRMNKDNRMILTTYGRSSGFCVDPIEKKPLNHFYPGSSILSFGTAGCNLGCKFCQNWDISKSKEMDRLADYASPEQISDSAIRLECKSVAFTYNDPVIFAEYAMDIAHACREKGIHTAAVTAGYITEKARGDFFSNMDAANVDLKAITEEFYKKLCSGKLAPVLETLKYLKHETKVWLEITNLIIPGENDKEEELHKLSEWIMDELGPDVPLHFSAFHPDFKLRDKSRTAKSILSKAQDIALSKGLRYVYTGNVVDIEGGSTYCHECKKMVIERNWYDLGYYNLNKNRCGSCGTVIPGHFDEKPGEWGRKRSPVYLNRS